MVQSLLRTLFLLLAPTTLLIACATLPPDQSGVSVAARQEVLSDHVRDLHAGNAHAAALALLEARYREMEDAEILALFKDAAAVARSAADQAYQRKDYVKAGGIYRALLECRALNEAMGRSAAIDQQVLEKQVRECSRLLTERGLEKYRDENIEEAVAVWKKVLLFDPENQSVIKAIETASRQRKRLQTMN